MRGLFVLLAAVLSFAELRVDSVTVDSVWNSDSASRVSRDCKISFIPQGSGQAYAFFAVSKDGGETFSEDRDSAYVLEEALGAILPCGTKKTVTVRVLGGDRQNFVVRISVRQANPDNWPNWRKRMTSPGTIYNISVNSISTIYFTFPGGEIPSQFSNNDGAAGSGATINGYGGGQWFRDVGDYGVVVFGSGGENFAGNMTGALNLNGAAARLEVWQQPAYSTTPGPGVEFYWNPESAAALPANRRFTTYNFNAASWDKVFPVAIDGWVYSYPMKYVEPLPGVPLGQYRYDQHCFIPKEYTGLGTGVWFIPSSFFMTPGFYYGSNDALMTDFWPGGGKKWYSHYQREDDKAWAHCETPVPEGMAYGSFGNQHVGFSNKYRKVAVPLNGPGGTTGVFDVSRGVENGSWSLQGGTIYGGSQGGRIGKSAVSNGHPRNRSFMVWLYGDYSGSPSGLHVLDFDDPALPVYNVALSGLKGSGENLGVHYIPGLNKFILFSVGTTAFCQKITVPDDLSNTAGYSVEDVSLALGTGVDLTTSYTASGMVQYIENMNCIVFMGVSRPAKAFWLE